MANPLGAEHLCGDLQRFSPAYLVRLNRGPIPVAGATSEDVLELRDMINADLVAIDHGRGEYHITMRGLVVLREGSKPGVIEKLALGAAWSAVRPRVSVLAASYVLILGLVIWRAAMATHVSVPQLEAAGDNAVVASTLLSFAMMFASIATIGETAVYFVTLFKVWDRLARAWSGDEEKQQ